MRLLPAFPVARANRNISAPAADATFPRIVFSVKLAALQRILAAGSARRRSPVRGVMGKTTLKSTGGTAKARRRLSPAMILALAGCSAAPRETFDLSGASKVAGARLSERGGTVVVAEPVALQPTASDRLVIRGAAGDLSVLSDAQWADRLPRLVRGAADRAAWRRRGRRDLSRRRGFLSAHQRTATLRDRRGQGNRGRRNRRASFQPKQWRETRRGGVCRRGARAPYARPRRRPAFDAALDEASARLVAWTRARI